MKYGDITDGQEREKVLVEFLALLLRSTFHHRRGIFRELPQPIDIGIP